jgi:hypothetical protein
MADRTDPPYFAGEREMLDAWLDYQRATLAGKCAGLSVGQLRERAVPPSSLSLIGLVRHMHEVERWWFGTVLAGNEPSYRYVSDEREDGDFDDVDTADVDGDLAAWAAACDDARGYAAAVASLDAGGARTRRNGEAVSLRWILVHMIEEYARHNGHADLLRECIDGTVGD